MRVVALAGAPNVGKSTLFNRLTGLRQHTGNWVGKTVETARGRCGGYTLVDLPGTWSLLPHSQEERVARDFLLRGGAEAVVVVCDAGCLERSLNLALQCRELCGRVLVCVNLLDEAARRGIRVDCAALSDALGLKVIGVVARRRESRAQVLRALDALLAAPQQALRSPPYPAPIEGALRRLEPLAAEESLPGRWLCLRLLAGEDWDAGPALLSAAAEERAALALSAEALEDAVTAALLGEAERVCRTCVAGESRGYSPRDRRLDRVLF